LAKSHHYLGLLCVDLIKRSESEAEFRLAVKEFERLVAEHPQVNEYGFNLAPSYYELGVVLRDSRQFSEALRCWGKAIVSFEGVIRDLGRDVPASLRQDLSCIRQARAEVCVRLGNYRGALADWEHALALSEGPDRTGIRVGLIDTLGRVGDYVRATAEAEDLLLTTAADRDVLYQVAGMFAHASDKSNDSTLAQRYASRAVTLLRQAVQKGYRDVANVKKDVNLDSLRQRADFQQLVQELERKATQPARCK
jgi:tetratricopeptide (TPR) repeat protein